MDRQRLSLRRHERGRLLLLVCAVSLVACGSPSPVGRPLAPGQVASRAAVDIGKRQTLAKHALGYHVAVSARAVISVELSTHFELVLRPHPEAAEQTKTRRIYIDAPTYDVLDLAISSAGETAYLASAAGWVRRYDLRSGELQQEWRMGSAVTALALSEDDQYLAIGTDRGTICLRRLQDGAQLQCMIAHKAQVGALAVHDQLLASASWQGELGLWSLPSLEKRSYMEGGKSVAALAFAPSGQSLAVARNHRAPIRSQELATREKKSLLVDDQGENQIELWQLRGGLLGDAPARRFVGHRALVSSLALSDTDLLSGSWDGTVRLWNTRTSSETRRVMGFQHIVRDIALAPRAGQLAVASWALSPEGALLTWLTLYFPKTGSR